VDGKWLYRFAEQLKGSGMSMSNNIAEGSGSSSRKEFHQYLNIARRSTFENANILIILGNRDLIAQELVDSLLESLDRLCRKITNFKKKPSQNPLAVCFFSSRHALCVFPLSAVRLLPYT
jgi:four helix bundle protein